MKTTIITTAALFFMATSFNSCDEKNKKLNDVPPDINIFSGRMECLWDENKQANPKAFLDIDKGIVYDVISAPAHAAEIDLIWTEAPGAVAIVSPNEYSPFYSPSEGDHPTFKESVLITSWSQRNQTLIGVHPTLTIADFKAISTSAQLNSSIGQVFNNTTS
jgi:hypothetical protein